MRGGIALVVELIGSSRRRRELGVPQQRIGRMQAEHLAATGRPRMGHAYPTTIGSGTSPTSGWTASGSPAPTWAVTTDLTAVADHLAASITAAVAGEPAPARPGSTIVKVLRPSLRLTDSSPSVVPGRDACPAAARAGEAQPWASTESFSQARHSARRDS